MRTNGTMTLPKGAIEIVTAIADCIRDLKSIPSGHLYVHLSTQMDLNSYQKVIDLLVRANLVKIHASHLLEWIGPEKELTTQPEEAKITL